MAREDVKIQIKVTDDGSFAVFDEAGNRVAELARETKQAGQALNSIGAGAKEAGQILASVGAKAWGSLRGGLQTLQSSVIALNQAWELIGRVFNSTARPILDTAESMARLRGQLQQVTSSSIELGDVQAELFRISNASSLSIESVADTYARMARSAGDLGASQADLLQVTETVTKALAATGASSVEASAGMIQLGQALASGRLNGDELRSVLEQMPAIGRLIAEGMKVPYGELRRLGEQGKLTSKAVFDAILSGKSKIDEIASTMPITISRGFSVLRNALSQAIDEIDQTTGASTKLGQAVRSLADNVRTWISTNREAIAQNVAGWIDGIRAAIERIPIAMQGIVAAWRSVAPILDLLKQFPVATAAAIGGVMAGPGGAAALGGAAYLATLPSRQEEAQARFQAESKIPAFKRQFESEVGPMPSGRYGVMFESLTPEQEAYTRARQRYIDAKVTEEKEKFLGLIKQRNLDEASGVTQARRQQVETQRAFEDIRRQYAQQSELAPEVSGVPNIARINVTPAMPANMTLTPPDQAEELARQARLATEREQTKPPYTPPVAFDAQAAEYAKQIKTASEENLATLEASLTVAQAQQSAMQKQLSVAKERNATDAEQLTIAKQVDAAEQAVAANRRAVLQRQIADNEAAIAQAERVVVAAKVQPDIPAEKIAQMERELLETRSKARIEITKSQAELKALAIQESALGGAVRETTKAIAERNDSRFLDQVREQSRELAAAQKGQTARTQYDVAIAGGQVEQLRNELQAAEDTSQAYEARIEIASRLDAAELALYERQRAAAEQRKLDAQDMAALAAQQVQEAERAGVSVQKVRELELDALDARTAAVETIAEANAELDLMAASELTIARNAERITEELKRSRQVTIDLSQTMSSGIGRAWEAMLTGGKPGEAFKEMSRSMVRELIGGFGESIAKKVQLFDVPLTENFTVKLPGIIGKGAQSMVSIWGRAMDALTGKGEISLGRMGDMFVAAGAGITSGLGKLLGATGEVTVGGPTVTVTGEAEAFIPGMPLTQAGQVLTPAMLAAQGAQLTAGGSAVSVTGAAGAFVPGMPLTAAGEAATVGGMAAAGGAAASSILGPIGIALASLPLAVSGIQGIVSSVESQRQFGAAAGGGAMLGGAMALTGLGVGMGALPLSVVTAPMVIGSLTDVLLSGLGVNEDIRRVASGILSLGFSEVARAIFDELGWFQGPTLGTVIEESLMETFQKNNLPFSNVGMNEEFPLTPGDVESMRGAGYTRQFLAEDNPMIAAQIARLRLNADQLESLTGMARATDQMIQEAVRRPENQPLLESFGWAQKPQEGVVGVGTILGGEDEMARIDTIMLLKHNIDAMGLSAEEASRWMLRLAQASGVDLVSGLEVLNKAIIDGELTAQQFTSAAADLTALFTQDLPKAVNAQSVLERNIAEQQSRAPGIAAQVDIAQLQEELDRLSAMFSQIEQTLLQGLIESAGNMAVFEDSVRTAVFDAVQTGLMDGIKESDAFVEFQRQIGETVDYFVNQYTAAMQVSGEWMPELSIGDVSAELERLQARRADLQAQIEHRQSMGGDESYLTPLLADLSSVDAQIAATSDRLNNTLEEELAFLVRQGEAMAEMLAPAIEAAERINAEIVRATAASRGIFEGVDAALGAALSGNIGDAEIEMRRSLANAISEGVKAGIQTDVADSPLYDELKGQIESITRGITEGALAGPDLESAIQVAIGTADQLVASLQPTLEALDTLQTQFVQAQAGAKGVAAGIEAALSAAASGRPDQVAGQFRQAIASAMTEGIVAGATNAVKATPAYKALKTQIDDIIKGVASGALAGDALQIALAATDENIGSILAALQPTIAALGVITSELVQSQAAAAGLAQGIQGALQSAFQGAPEQAESQLRTAIGSSILQGATAGLQAAFIQGDTYKALEQQIGSVIDGIVAGTLSKVDLTVAIAGIGSNVDALVAELLPAMQLLEAVGAELVQAQAAAAGLKEGIGSALSAAFQGNAFAGAEQLRISIGNSILQGATAGLQAAFAATASYKALESQIGSIIDGVVSGTLSGIELSNAISGLGGNISTLMAGLLPAIQALEEVGKQLAASSLGFSDLAKLIRQDRESLEMSQIMPVDREAYARQQFEESQRLFERATTPVEKKDALEDARNWALQLVQEARGRYAEGSLAQIQAIADAEEFLAWVESQAESTALALGAQEANTVAQEANTSATERNTAAINAAFVNASFEDVLAELAEMLDRQTIRVETQGITPADILTALEAIGASVSDVLKTTSSQNVTEQIVTRSIAPEVNLEPIEPSVELSPIRPTVDLVPIRPEVELEAIKPAVDLAPIKPAVELPNVDLAPITPTVDLAPIKPTVDLAPIKPEILLDAIKPPVEIEPIKPTVDLAPIKPAISVPDINPMVNVPTIHPMVDLAPIRPEVDLSAFKLETAGIQTSEAITPPQQRPVNTDERHTAALDALARNTAENTQALAALTRSTKELRENMRTSKEGQSAQVGVSIAQVTRQGLIELLRDPRVRIEIQQAAAGV